MVYGCAIADSSVGGLAESSVSSDEEVCPWDALSDADPFRVFSKYNNSKDDLKHHHESFSTTDTDVTEEIDFSEQEDLTEEPDLTEYDLNNDDDDDDDGEDETHNINNNNGKDDDKDDHSVYTDQFSNITLTFVNADAPPSPEKATKKSKKKTKQAKTKTTGRTPTVRFASNPDGSVKCDLHEFEKVECNKQDVWYTYAQLDEIQESACAYAHAFKDQHAEYYCRAISGLYYSYKKHVSMDEIYHHLLQLVSQSEVRGLEPQIVHDMSFKVIKKHRKNVLKAQQQHRVAAAAAAGGDVKTRQRVMEKELKRVSKLTSKPGRQLAEKMAEYDTYEALAAIFS